MIRKALTISAMILAVLLVVSAAGCSITEPAQQKAEPITVPEDTEDAHQDALKDELSPAAPLTQELPAAQEQLGFAGANIGQGGLMAGDGEWVYFRSESDWGLYRARTDGSEQTQLLPPEDYAPSSINVLGGWVYFSNFRDGFSLWRVRTDGSEAEKLVDGYCHTFLVAESGIYFDCRDENNVMRTFHAELDGSAQTLLYESCAPTTYYEGKLYLYDFRSGTLYAYNTEANEREILFEGKYDAAFFSADDTGIYFWDDMCDYCHLDPETKEITVLHQGPIGDYFNYYDGTVYYVAYGGITTMIAATRWTWRQASRKRSSRCRRRCTTHLGIPSASRRSTTATEIMTQTASRRTRKAGRWCLTNLSTVCLL